MSLLCSSHACVCSRLTLFSVLILSLRISGFGFLWSARNVLWSFDVCRLVFGAAAITPHIQIKYCHRQQKWSTSTPVVALAMTEMTKNEAGDDNRLLTMRSVFISLSPSFTSAHRNNMNCRLTQFLDFKNFWNERRPITTIEDFIQYRNFILLTSSGKKVKKKKRRKNCFANASARETRMSLLLLECVHSSVCFNLFRRSFALRYHCVR